MVGEWKKEASKKSFPLSFGQVGGEGVAVAVEVEVEVVEAMDSRLEAYFSFTCSYKPPAERKSYIVIE